MARALQGLKACSVGRLDPEFSNKLGLLVGNLVFSNRTPEWNDNGGKGLCGHIGQTIH